jgi:hypothetical protein
MSDSLPPPQGPDDSSGGTPPPDGPPQGYGYGAPPPPPPLPPYGTPGYGFTPPQQAPSNNLVWGILTTIFCCLPFGIVSIVYAAKVDSQWAMGQYDLAIDSSKKARTWAIVSAAVTGGLLALYFFGILIFGIFATTQSGGS